MGDPWLTEHYGPVSVHVIERTEEANTEFARGGYGHGVVYITQEHIGALLNGSGIAFNDGEYTHAIYLRPNDPSQASPDTSPEGQSDPPDKEDR